MARKGMFFRLIAVFAALAVTVLSVGFSWAVVDDYSRRDIVPRGAMVEGVHVGGLTRSAAVALVRTKIEALLLEPLTVTFRGKSFTLDTQKYLSVDVEGMVDDTFKPQDTATLPQRVYRRVTDEPVSVNVVRKLRLDNAGVGAWLGGVAKQVYLPAVDASITVANESLKFTKDAVGYKLDQVRSLATLHAALVGGKRGEQSGVKLSVYTIKPKADEASLGRSILVVKSTRHLTLYDGFKVVKEYPVAIGMPGHPTPEGWWFIENKRYMPSWTNNGSSWAAGMPAYIAPGYSNPLGTRALDLNASGIRIHGSSNDYSIGSAASHGCMRMHMWDIEDLYPRVEVGTRVIIIQ